VLLIQSVTELSVWIGRSIFWSEVVLFGIGSMTIFVFTFGKLRAAPIKAGRAFSARQAGGIGRAGESGGIL